MSHFTVLVIGPDPEAQLAPYDENTVVDRYKRYIDTDPTSWPMSLAAEAGIDPSDYGAVAAYLSTRWSDERHEADEKGVYTWSTYNPDSKWDWYSLGGRWTGFFLLKEGAQGAQGEPGIFTKPAKQGYADAARKGDVDFLGMQLAHAADAASEFDRWWAIAGENLPPRWSEVRDRHPGDIDAARSEYSAHPTVQALRVASLDTFSVDVLDHYGTDRDAYIARVGRSRCTTFALVAEGAWKGKGDMGWFGISTNEAEHEDWQSFWWGIVDNLPDDTLLSVFDCHI